jgi:iron(III) transport system permease protein
MCRSLGRSRWNAFRTVVLPHLLPSLLAGWLVVGLYVLGDFGAVALMRYEVFSYAIFTQYSGAFDRIYAAWLSLMLMVVTVVFVLMEARLRGKRYARVGKGDGARRRAGAARPLPPAGLAFHRPRGGRIARPAGTGADLLDVGRRLRHRFRRTRPGLSAHGLVAIPAALISTMLALPVVYLTVRFPSPFSSVVERLTYMGYAVPPLAFALSMVFFALNVAPFLYQSLTLLIFAYCMTFLALALGPIRSRMLQIGPRLEEVSRSLGHGAFSIPTCDRPSRCCANPWSRPRCSSSS